MPPPPLVSVVVSTHNRPERLARLLAALRAQTIASDRFEVVVVDNGSRPETASILDREQAHGGLPLRTLRLQTTAGPAGGRNLGWHQAVAPLVAFTDDDCQPSPQWLTAILAAAAAHPGAVLQGPTRPAPDELERDGLLSHTVRIEGLGPQYETCNIAYPRAVLEALGGFDERFGRQPSGEDTDLAWRAIAAGRETVFVPAAVVHHAVEPIGVSGMLRRAARWSAVVRVFADHPGTRSMLYRGRFWNVWHYLLYRSLLALAGPPWLRRLLITRHLLALRRRARSSPGARSVRRGAGPAAVFFLLVHDSVECWAVARGAIRYRTLVL
ncbi:MAG: glycosyltransferase family 2 protein [Solirubrobacteraceae bacterium]